MGNCSLNRLLLWSSFLLSLFALSFSGFCHNKSWFDVPNDSKSPSFGLWHVCYDGQWRDCQNVMAEDDTYSYGTALFVARACIIMSMVFNLILMIMGAMTLMGSYKLVGHTYSFLAVASIATFLILLGCAVFEGGVRLRVIQKMTEVYQTNLDTETHFAGFSAWAAFAASAINCGVSGLFYVRTRNETYI